MLSSSAGRMPATGQAPALPSAPQEYWPSLRSTLARSTPIQCCSHSHAVPHRQLRSADSFYVWGLAILVACSTFTSPSTFHSAAQTSSPSPPSRLPRPSSCSSTQEPRAQPLIGAEWPGSGQTALVTVGVSCECPCLRQSCRARSL